MLHQVTFGCPLVSENTVGKTGGNLWIGCGEISAPQNDTIKMKWLSRNQASKWFLKKTLQWKDWYLAGSGMCCSGKGDYWPAGDKVDGKDALIQGKYSSWGCGLQDSCGLGIMCPKSWFMFSNNPDKAHVTFLLAVLHQEWAAGIAQGGITCCQSLGRASVTGGGASASPYFTHAQPQTCRPPAPRTS